MSATMFSASVVLSPAGHARRVAEARRRAAHARHYATKRPTTLNQIRAEELEAGLKRMEAEAQA